MPTADQDTDLRFGRCGVEVGQVWKRNPPGRERLRIERVWQGYVIDHPEVWTVRAQPMHGGAVVITSPHWIAENYAQDRAAAPRFSAKNEGDDR